jgi:hypothetical protein
MVNYSIFIDNLMSIKRKKHISLIIGLFLASFLGALTLSTLCELEIVKFASADSHVHSELNQNANYGRQHALDHHDDSGSDQKRSTDKNQTQDSANDECCSEVASTLESSLFSDVSEIKVPLATFFLAGIIETADFVVPLYHFNNSLFHEYDDPPPLNGFKLRVVIQSFLT